MSHKHYRGPSIPDADDPILESLDAMMSTALISTVASSVASARAIVESAVNDGKEVSTANPMKFLIGQNEYVSDGAQASGKYRLAPVNEVEFSEVAYKTDQTITRVGPGLYNRLVTADLPTRPYDRVAIGWGVGTGDVKTGRFNLVVRMQGIKDGQIARWDSADNMNTVSTMNLAKIPAGTDPDINLSTLSAGTETNTVDMASANNATKLVVLAFPITMA